jgi:hypothetical protein
LAIAAAFHIWPFGESPDVRIDIAASQVNTRGYDNASDEYICLVNKSGGDVDLLGWELRDAEGSVSVLPDSQTYDSRQSETVAANCGPE